MGKCPVFRWETFSLRLFSVMYLIGVAHLFFFFGAALFVQALLAFLTDRKKIQRRKEERRRCAKSSLHVANKG